MNRRIVYAADMSALPQLDVIRNDVPLHWRDRFEAIIALTDAVCREHLNDEYLDLTRLLAGCLCQDGSPADRGQVRVWAAAVVYTVGWVNFLSDPNNDPHLRTDELCRLFGVSESAMSRRSTEIREGLDIVPLDPNWCLPSRMESNPLAWMVEGPDGIILDARMLAPEIQEQLAEAGIIPFVPQGGLKLVGEMPE
ncbi:MAG: hypothetical protein HRU76_12405 [Phycisphaeraceae bacterium]|nr:MAG: hypothetical protein HRU76_12405 [Phycisphaeraceae bacterium]